MILYWFFHEWLLDFCRTMRVNEADGRVVYCLLLTH